MFLKFQHPDTAVFVSGTFRDGVLDLTADEQDGLSSDFQETQKWCVSVRRQFFATFRECREWLREQGVEAVDWDI